MSNLAENLDYYTPTSLIKKKTIFGKIKREIKRVYLIHIKERILYGAAQKKFYLLFGGHIFFQSLYAASKFHVFDILKKRGTLTLSEIAAILKIEEQPCRILLLPLVVAGIIKGKNGEYKATRLSNIFLTTDGEWKYLDCLEWQARINYRALEHFYESVKENTNVGLSEFAGTEPTLYQRLAHVPELEEVFQRAMQEISKQSHGLLTEFVDFTGVKHLVDVGGGNGTNIIKVAEAYPEIKGSIFDFPSVCERAWQNIEKHKLSNRLGIIEGNVFEDKFPQDVDCIMFCHFFTIWSKEENLTLLKKAHEALPEGGRAIVFNMMQENDGTRPITPAVGSPYFLALATGRGMLYSWIEYEELFEKAGFRKVESIRLPRDHGAIIGIK